MLSMELIHKDDQDVFLYDEKRDLIAHVAIEHVTPQALLMALNLLNEINFDDDKPDLIRIVSDGLYFDGKFISAEFFGDLRNRKYSPERINHIRTITYSLD